MTETRNLREAAQSTPGSLKRVSYLWLSGLFLHRPGPFHFATTKQLHEVNLLAAGELREQSLLHETPHTARERTQMRPRSILSAPINISECLEAAHPSLIAGDVGLPGNSLTCHSASCSIAYCAGRTHFARSAEKNAVTTSKHGLVLEVIAVTSQPLATKA